MISYSNSRLQNKNSDFLNSNNLKRVQNFKTGAFSKTEFQQSYKCSNCEQILVADKVKARSNKEERTKETYSKERNARNGFLSVLNNRIAENNAPSNTCIFLHFTEYLLQ
jgi:hypothetical protein